MSRFRRLARDYERLPETLAGLHSDVPISAEMVSLQGVELALDTSANAESEQGEYETIDRTQKRKSRECGQLGLFVSASFAEIGCS